MADFMPVEVTPELPRIAAPPAPAPVVEMAGTIEAVFPSDATVRLAALTRSGETSMP